MRSLVAYAAVACSLLAAPAVAQPPAYGPAITLAQARSVADAAEAEARRNSWNVVVAIVDPGGHLVLLHRLDDTQWASVQVAQRKAYTAVGFRRPSQALEDALNSPGGMRILALEGATPLQGGLPLLVDGKIVGAIGVSGVTGEQDTQIAKAGASALAR
jgi:glc operon protein GlcG